MTLDYQSDETSPSNPIRNISDVLGLTKEKVLGNLMNADKKDLAEVYAASSVTWVDKFGNKRAPDFDTQQKILRYLSDKPVTRSDVAMEVAISFSDLYSTWRNGKKDGEPGFVSEVSPEARTKVVAWLIEGAQKDPQVVIKDFAEYVSGRIATGDSVLTGSDLQEFISAVEPTIKLIGEKDEDVQKQWGKINQDLTVATSMDL